MLARRVEHHPFAAIAADEGIAESTARSDYRRALEALKRDQDEQASFLVARQLAVLDAAAEAVWGVLRREHLTVSHGKIIARQRGYELDPETGDVLRDGEGQPVPHWEPLPDDAPVLAATDRLIKIEERRARLKGMDAPTKIEVDDGRAAAIRAVGERLAARRVGELEPGGAGAPAEDAPGAGSVGEAH